MSYKPYDTYDKNDTAMDAWGRPKVYLDHSILHGVFTYDVPNSLWIIKENGTELLDNSTSTRVKSTGGRLVIDSGTILNECGCLHSRTNPRYQPNRGHLFSTAIGLPNPTADGVREFGLFNSENGVFFRLKKDGLYAVIRSDSIETKEELINIPFSIDLSKGNVYDIQFQWRGVGDYNFFIENPEIGKIVLVHKISFINRLDEQLSIQNPAIPVGFKSIFKTDFVSFWLGCFDVTSEGGGKIFSKYNQQGSNINGTSVSNGKMYSILALKFNKTFNGKLNTRDSVLRRIITSAKDENKYKVIVTRDESTFDGTTWTNKGSNDNIQFSEGTDIDFTENQYCKTIMSGRTEIDIKNELNNPINDGSSDFTLTGGDFIIIQMRTDGSSKKAWASFEWTEEV